MSLDASCPICTLVAGQRASRITFENRSVISPGRHVSSWTDLQAQEQLEILSMVSTVFQENAPEVSATTINGHYALEIGSHTGCRKDPARLIGGGEDQLLPHLTKQLDDSKEVDLAIAFALESGVNLIFPWLEDLLERGGCLRLIVGDYLDVTEPAALRRLRDLNKEALPGRFDSYVFETQGKSFHPKAWLFRTASTECATIVGSSNLTRSALTDGVEWNLCSTKPEDCAAVLTTFEALLRHPNVKPLTDTWIDSYAARRRANTLPAFATSIANTESPREIPEPHGIQIEALAALDASRRAGHRAGLVVLATGLGKTWLSAFDSRQFKRVLFIAHREEILAQAMATFRRIRPDASFGRYTGTAKEKGEIVFASIQTLGRLEHLRRFSPDEFDYIVVDEFHHAAARSYRELLDYFSPQFLLGLTATPERSDGGDLLSLCGENLVFRCDLYEGVSRELLSPFHYFGVPDEVDYEHIPWRSSRFDEEALTTAVATTSRANNALNELRKHGQGPAIGFCASQRHADFMAGHFKQAGLKTAAVHSGPSSAPRTSSLEALARGDLDILFAVDMFNEGVDVPNIGTVLILRPTESTILFLQQLGRGMRKFGDKVLRVIDYIGNHRIFLTKARALLLASEGDRSLLQRLEAVAAGDFPLPPGCKVTYDLEALDMLRAMLSARAGSNEAEAWYLDFRTRMGERPTASEFSQAGFHPSRTGHGSWFSFVRDMGDEVPEAAEVHRDFLQGIEGAEYDTMEALLMVQAFLPSLSSGATMDSLWERAVALGSRRGLTLARPAFKSAWDQCAASSDFRVDGQRAFLRRTEAPGVRDLASELIDWHLGSILNLGSGDGPKLQPNSVPVGTPVLWHEYMREDIPPLFGATFNPGSWNSGIVSQGNNLILLTTLNKGSLASGNHYEDRFLSPSRLQWQSQTQTRQASKHGQIFSGKSPGHNVHLFVRSEKLRGGKAAPFLYLGQPRFSSWHGEKPITIEWDLTEPVPEHFRKMLKVP